MALALPALLTLFAFLVCLGLSAGYRSTFGLLLSHLADLFIRATWNGPLGISIGFAFIGNAISDLDNYIRDGLAAGLTATEWAWHQTVKVVALSFQDLGHAIEGSVIDTYQALGYLRRQVLPATIAVSLTPVWTAVHGLQAAVTTIEQTARVIPKDITKVIYRDVPQALTRAEEAAIAALVHVPAAVQTVITLPGIGIKAGEREVDALKRRLGQLADRLTPAGVVGLVSAAVFGVLGLGWLKCSNVGKAAKQVCGMDAGLLEALLADAVLIFGTLSLVEFAETMLAAIEELSGEVLGGWRETAKVEPLTFTGYTGKLG